MQRRFQVVLLLVLGLVAIRPLRAQVAAVPVLAVPPNVLYPPIAKVAHISGEVVVTFAINPDGTTTSVQAVSGPPMLVAAVVNPIKQWRFKTPLPMGTGSYFEAKYAFATKTKEDDEDEDSLDRPPYRLCCGDSIATKDSPAALTGEVKSLDGSQTIDVSPAAANVADRCAKDTHRQPPEKTDFSDFVELLRANCDEGCPSYLVRVYRNGRVAWRGFHDVIATGDRDALLDSSTADALLTSFQGEEFWSACSVAKPSEPKPQVQSSDNEVAGVFVTVGMGGVVKTVNASQYSFSNSDVGENFAWAIDRTADTHRWRHPDPATEPYDNMYDDLDTPKPGTTLLIRATFHFDPYTLQQTFTYLDKLLKRGEPVDAADASGWTALMYASYLDCDLAGHTDGDPFKLLLDAHADPNRASLHGDTALMFAAYRGTLLQPLLAHGANLNAHNADGVTPLMLLAQSSHPDAIEEAIAAGADVSAHDNLGRTALDYLRAASCGKPVLPLPASRGMVALIVTLPQPCPANTPVFKHFESLLRTPQAATAP